MRGVVLFVLFAMNMMSAMGLFTTFVAKNISHGNFYLVNENIVYFCFATVVFNIVSLIFMIDKKL